MEVEKEIKDSPLMREMMEDPLSETMKYRYEGVGLFEDCIVFSDTTIENWGYGTEIKVYYKNAPAGNGWLTEFNNQYKESEE